MSWMCRRFTSWLEHASDNVRASQGDEREQKQKELHGWLKAAIGKFDKESLGYRQESSS